MASAVDVELPSQFVGAKVTLRGLSRSELNGRTGKLLSYDAATGRLGVQVDGLSKTLAIKPINLAEFDQTHINLAHPRTCFAHGTEKGPGIEVCPLCSELLIGTHVDTLACGHSVHHTCWVKHNFEELARWKAGAELRGELVNLRCPVCDAWHGPAHPMVVGTQEHTIVNAQGRHQKISTQWWHRDAKDLIHQVIGYTYQHHCQKELGREATLDQEKVFVTRCRNRGQKAHGGQHALDALDVALKQISETGRDEVEQAKLVQLLEQLVECCRLHMVDTKKGRVVDHEDAGKWMGYVKRWIRTIPGLTCEVVELVKGLPSG